MKVNSEVNYIKWDIWEVLDWLNEVRNQALIENPLNLIFLVLQLISTSKNHFLLNHNSISVKKTNFQRIFINIMKKCFS